MTVDQAAETLAEGIFTIICLADGFLIGHHLGKERKRKKENEKEKVC